MRCHFSEKDEESNCGPSEINIWTSTTVQNPSVLKCVDNLNGIENKSYSDDLSTFYSLDSVSQSYKRKILECEREDFDEKFSKIQRKRQILRATARANFVVDDDDNEFDEESEIYEQMEWIDSGSNAMTLRLWKDSDVDLSFQSISSRAPIMYIPKFNWREERHHLLRISMAKIRGVDDPEMYLRRSVLINNTVRRLQTDVAVNCRQSVASSSLFQGNDVYQNECSTWDSENFFKKGVCKDHLSEPKGFHYSRAAGTGSSTSYIYSESPTSMPYNFQLSVITPLSPDKPDSFQNEIIQNSIIFSKCPQDDQVVYDTSLSYRITKQTSPVHVFSSQPCGVQYRNLAHEGSNEYHESSNTSSILDSVVYHSLIASLET